MEIIRKQENIYLIPKIHQHTIVWLHGTIQSANTYLSLFLNCPLLPNCKIVMLTAPKFPNQIYNGRPARTWHRLNLPELSYINDISAKNSEQISKVLQEESKLTNSLLIGGFSQGGAIALNVAFVQCSIKVRGVIILSSFSYNIKPREDRRDIPIFVYHGKSDRIVPHIRGYVRLNNAFEGFNIYWYFQDDMGHYITSRQIEMLKYWLRTVILNK